MFSKGLFFGVVKSQDCVGNKLGAFTAQIRFFTSVPQANLEINVGNEASGSKI